MHNGFIHWGNMVATGECLTTVKDLHKVAVVWCLSCFSVQMLQPSSSSLAILTLCLLFFVCVCVCCSFYSVSTESLLILYISPLTPALHQSDMQMFALTGSLPSSVCVCVYILLYVNTLKSLLVYKIIGIYRHPHVPVCVRTVCRCGGWPLPRCCYPWHLLKAPLKSNKKK